MNQPFHQGSYQQRYTQMGDEAESHFEKNNTAWVRYGLNRPDFQVHRLPHHIRYTPDYLQGDPVRLVEVMGMGRTPLKIKLEKLAALQWWDASGIDVWLWIWSSTRENFAELKYRDMMNIINKEDAPLGKFPEGKAFFNVSSKLLPWNDA